MQVVGACDVLLPLVALLAAHVSFYRTVWHSTLIRFVKTVLFIAEQRSLARQYVLVHCVHLHSNLCTFWLNWLVRNISAGDSLVFLSTSNTHFR